MDCPHSLIIDEREIDNVVTTDRAMRSPHPKRWDTDGSHDMRQENEEEPKAYQQPV